MKKRQVQEEPKQTPFEIGRTGTVEEFGAANDAAITNQSKGKHLKSTGDWFFSPTYPRHLGTETQHKLLAGAVQALYEEYPENIQAVMLDPVRFAIRSGTVSNRTHSESFLRLGVLRQLIDGRSDAADDIRLALAAFEPEKKQEIINDILNETVKVGNFRDKTAFITALLDAGADANARNGETFAWAIYNDLPEDTIQLLFDKGASFRDALFVMEKDSDKWKQKTITRLGMYRKKFTGEADDELSAVKKELAELNERFNTLSQQLTAQAAPGALRVSSASNTQKPIRISRQP